VVVEKKKRQTKQNSAWIVKFLPCSKNGEVICGWPVHYLDVMSSKHMIVFELPLCYPIFISKMQVVHG
jgi:hypothetical protein